MEFLRGDTVRLKPEKQKGKFGYIIFTIRSGDSKKALILSTQQDVFFYANVDDVTFSKNVIVERIKEMETLTDIMDKTADF